MRLIICFLLFTVIPLCAQEVQSLMPSRKSIRYIVDQNHEYILSQGQVLNGSRLSISSSELDSVLFYSEISKHSSVTTDTSTIFVMNTSTDFKVGYYTIDLVEVTQDEIRSVNASHEEVSNIGFSYPGIKASAVTLWQDSLALFQALTTKDFYTMNWSGEFSDPVASSYLYSYLREISSGTVAQSEKSLHLLADDLSIIDGLEFVEDIQFTKVIEDRIFVVLQSSILELNDNIEMIHNYTIPDNWTITGLTLADDLLRIIRHRNSNMFDTEILELQEDETWQLLNATNLTGVNYHGFVTGSNGTRLFGDQEIDTYQEKPAYSIIDSKIDLMHDYAPDIDFQIVSAVEYIDTVDTHFQPNGDTVYKTRLRYGVSFDITNKGNEMIKGFELFSSFVNVPWGGTWYYKKYEDIEIAPNETLSFDDEINYLFFDELCLFIQSCNGKLDAVRDNNSDCIKPMLSSSNINLLVAEIDIYPNPVDDILYVASDDEIVLLDLLDINGQSLNRAQSFTNHSLDLSDIQSGIYFLLLSDRSGRRVYKKIVKR